jgi:WD40 repeat protein
VLAHPKPLSDFEFCPHVTQKNLLATTSADETVKLWDLNVEQKETTVPTLEFNQDVSMGVINSVR